MATGALVGRREEQARLEEALEGAEAGRGSLLLVAGEAGVGKTRLITEVARGSAATFVQGRASQGAATPYGPIVAALRSHLRACPDAFADCGPLLSHLALLLPELGEPAPASDQGTLFEALTMAFAHLAPDGSVMVGLDDLQWSDDATLDLLATLAGPLRSLPVVVVAAYRSDGLPRDHTLRRLRHDLRRSGHLDELTLTPLDEGETAQLLEQVLGQVVAPSLARAIHDRTQGVPFFVEELARALLLTDAVTAGPRGLELAGGGQVPVPDTVRDAVLISTAELSPQARTAADTAAVAGEELNLDVVAGLAGAAGTTELLEGGLIVESAPGMGTFRHSLTREALYADLPWIQRRALHRRLAEALEIAGATSSEVATQWLGAREEARAREALLKAAEESRKVHAYRDAARAGRQALDLWPEGDAPARREAALESYAQSAELSGELTEAARAWRELRTLRTDGAREAYAETERRLAAIYDLKGDREAAFIARRAAADAYADADMHAEAAVERLAIGNYARGSADYSTAIEMAQAAAAHAKFAQRLDLSLRATGLEGVARAKGGDPAAGLALVRNGLAQALEHELTPVAAELYQRLSLVIYDAADYRHAQQTLETALELCQTEGDRGTEVACVTCMVYVLRECGEWAEALKLGRELISSDTAVWVAEGLIGGIYGYQGKLSSARRLLSSSHAVACQVDHYNMSVDTAGGLARVAAAEGNEDEAAERCRWVLSRWERSEDHHYAVKVLAWGAGFLARRGDSAGAHACSEALARIASKTGHADALAALAQAIGESALADGDAGTAAEQLGHAVDLHHTLDLPVEQAEVALRSGVAMAAAGEREPALERLGDAYRAARKLGARPLAAEAAREVAALGESVAARLGRRAATDAATGGLTPREMDVLRLVAVGRTNREIAQELFLSPRTIDMHVRNILRKLDAHSRGEATHKAGELGLLA